MQYVGNIISIFISKEGSSNRFTVDKINLDELGIIEDKYYNRNINRSVLLTSTDSYKLANENNISMEYGSLGENLLMDFNPYSLAAGDKLQIGDVILEISQNCTMCDHLSSIDPILPELLQNDRGIFSKVIKNGLIKNGDKIYKR